jgi:hypothetical protein
MRNVYKGLVLKSEARIQFKIILDEICGRLWTGFIWLRIGTSGGVF